MTVIVDTVDDGGAAGAGVASLNGATGDATLAPADSSIVIGGVAPHLTLQAPVGGGTLATFSQNFAFGQPPRFFAVDQAAGNDANLGYSDVSQAAAGLVAIKTLARLMQILPRFGQGRACRVAIRAGNYASDTQWTIDGLRGLANVSQGNACLFIGTDTVASAGATAFQGDLNDSLCAGFTTATGMNAAGYNVTAYAVDAEGTPTMTLQLNGGGSPAFVADSVARPYGCRLRFDVATATAGLRNKMTGILRTTGAGSLVASVALPVAPVVGDVVYIEMPGVFGPAQTLVSGIGDSRGAQVPQFVGIRFGNLFLGDSIVTFCACEAGNVVANCCDVRCQDSASDLSATFTNPTRGMGLLSTFYSHSTGGSYFGTGCATTSTTSYGFAWLGLESVTWERSASKSGVQKVGGGAPGGNVVIEIIGTSISTAHGATCQIFGPGNLSAGSQPAAGVFVAGHFNGGRFKCENMGAAPAIKLAGTGVPLQMLAGSGSTGNTGVGLDLTSFTGAIGGIDCTISMGSAAIGLGTTPTVTGTAGDIKLANGQIVTWAQVAATGLVDTAGNRFTAPPSTAPLAVIGKFSGAIVTSAVGATTSYLADSGSALAVANLATPQRYPSSLRFCMRLRVVVTAVSGALSNAVTATVYQGTGGGAPVTTTMKVNIPAGTAVGTTFVDTAHVLLFLDGDTFDVRLDDVGADAGAGTLAVSAALEGPV